MTIEKPDSCRLWSVVLKIAVQDFQLGLPKRDSISLPLTRPVLHFFSSSFNFILNLPQNRSCLVLKSK